jgi:hypothetical protein
VRADADHTRARREPLCPDLIEQVALDFVVLTPFEPILEKQVLQQLWARGMDIEQVAIPFDHDVHLGSPRLACVLDEPTLPYARHNIATRSSVYHFGTVATIPPLYGRSGNPRYRACLECLGRSRG